MESNLFPLFYIYLQLLFLTWIKKYFLVLYKPYNRPVHRRNSRDNARKIEKELRQIQIFLSLYRCNLMVHNNIGLHR